MINSLTVQKHLSNESGTISYFNMLIDRYRENDDWNIAEIISNMTKEHALWFS